VVPFTSGAVTCEVVPFSLPAEGKVYTVILNKIYEGDGTVDVQFVEDSVEFVVTVELRVVELVLVVTFIQGSVELTVVVTMVEFVVTVELTVVVTMVELVFVVSFEDS